MIQKWRRVEWEEKVPYTSKEKVLKALKKMKGGMSAWLDENEADDWRSWKYSLQNHLMCLTYGNASQD